MIVNHLSTGVQGGAAIAARRLHHALLSAGVESRFWAARLDPSTTRDASYRTIRWERPAGLLGAIGGRFLAPARRLLLRWRLKHALAGRPPGLDLFSLPHLPHRTQAGPHLTDGVLHLHWVAKMFDYPSFFASLPDGLPIVWTLHDMLPFTGGCHFSGGCDAYLTECRSCPQLGRPGEKDLANVAFHTKRRALRGKNLHVVAPSHWMTREAKRSRLFANARSVRTIHPPLETNLYQPSDQAQARRQFGLPDSHRIIAFRVAAAAVHRQGISELLAALRLLDSQHPVTAVAFGTDPLPPTDPDLPPIRHLGPLSDPQSRALFYSAADLFLLPSLEENLPQVGLESMACGTPVVGFAAGGVPEFVRPQQTGLLAKAGSPQDLARQVNWLLQHPGDCRRMGHNARQMIEREFSPQSQAPKYIDLYRELLADHARHAPAAPDRRLTAA